MLSAGRQTDILLILESSAAAPMDAGLTYAPHVSGFAGTSDGTPVHMQQQFQIAPGETVVHVPLFPISAGQAAVFALDNNGFRLEKRGVSCALRENVRLEVPVVRGEPAQTLAEQITGLSPQELWVPAADGIPLAGVRFIKSGEQCLLEEIFPIGGDARIPLPYLQEHLRGCLACFPETETHTQPLPPAPPSPPAPVPPAPEPRRPACSATGVAQLNLGLHARKGDVLRTGEIAHGLSPGTVFLDFGLEDVQPGPGYSERRTSLFLGDASLFEDAGTVCCNCAARVFPEKGTFELAVRLCGEPQRSMLRLRWFVWRTEEEAPPAPSGKVGRLVRLNPDVVIIRPGETIGFSAVFEGGESVPCKFSVIDRYGGSITRDGIYTAPDQIGLYQVQAQVCGAPEQSAHAFVLVKEAVNGGV